MTRLILPALGLWLLAACADPGPEAPVPISPVSLAGLPGHAPPGAPPGTCWDRVVSPAVVETETAQVLVEPAQLRDDGSVAQPASYRTETRQQIVRERQETWFEALCADALTGEFVASLQRALQVRGIYDGPITGLVDTTTREAVLAYQLQDGLDSGTLSLRTARELGLVAVELNG
ncbi:peptidoglycan-binding domain-containing protein [Marinibacterium profundimaris]|uniref:Peptidoglycan-binding protein n=1 Tax=Marinibacterium profundimaris TaxID=1679460 RepID=A0A225NNG9_9RHOB|nr:peptidoglycan-binding domain-containing protein [Marinibacterium profundimaris]OWU72600.1 peptidoglycan-binding protein [Marinibacterium profundimaris]